MAKLDDAAREALKQRTIAAFERFADYHATLLDHHPQLLERVIGMLDAANELKHVSIKLRHLIWIAVDAVCTHLYERGIRIHTLFAMQHGATEMEIFESLAIATQIGLRSYQDGIGIVLEETAAEGDSLPAGSAARAESDAVRAYREANGGEGWLAPSLAHSRHNVAALIDLATPTPGGLDAKSAELIALSVECCPAVNNPEGIRRHARNAVRLGATREELIEVLDLASGISLHAVSVGAPIVEKALEEFKVTGGRQLP